jgi:hypothetical protein
MRNLRWTDCVHYLLDVILEIPLLEEKRKTVLSILAEQEATSAGQTIPSYRIPLLWESLFLKIREAISMDVNSIDSTDDAAAEHSVSSEEMHSGGEGTVSVAAPKVAPRQSKPRRRKNDGAASTSEQ